MIRKRHVTRSCVVERVSLFPDWGEKIITRMKDQDLTAKDARYHPFCQRKVDRLPFETGAKKGYRPARNVDEAMEYIYSYLEEKSEECQFSMEELLN
ncbi:hypothetical protein AVEN_71416-1 [Araneus ventricosus]|uniref:Uncharacterized protein n=1 Tax=Araneus ventricosus TaxID=182803 RepID=A0A4Y2BHP7_ARAVE|nr:hypothetical protein AVEN_71416-1 [Araneus ventricosus]